MSIKNAVKKAFDKKKRLEKKDADGNWKYPMYWLIDLHDVIIPGTYTRQNDGRDFYPAAKDVLNWLTKRKDMCIILWTSSHHDSIENICLWLKEHAIEFNYINNNPEVLSNELLNTTSKTYFDVLLDDKAGFSGEEDWKNIKYALIEVGEWDKKLD